MSLFPAELRRVFLDEHAQLTRELDALEGLLPRATDAHVAEELRQRAGRFSTQLLAHIDHEERLLRPLLADDAWGYQRVQVMDGDHASQRVRVAALAQQLPGAVDQWHGPLAQLISAVRQDIRSEEREAFAR